MSLAIFFYVECCYILISKELNLLLKDNKTQGNNAGISRSAIFFPAEGHEFWLCTSLTESGRDLKKKDVVLSSQCIPEHLCMWEGFL